MKILVSVKRVIDPNVKVRIKSDGSGVEMNSVKMAMNPFDEVAVEQAIQLKEAGIVSEIVVVCVGPAQSQDVIRTAMAMGADRGILIETAEMLEQLAVAKLLREVVRAEQPGMVIMGKQASDDDCNQTGQLLAGLLGWPQATYASKIIVNDGRLEVTREIDKGTETVAMGLPAVVTTDLRLNEPRFTTMPSIMKARRLPLAVTPAAQFGLDLAPRLETLRVDEPAQRAVGVRVKNVQELAEKLKSVLGVV
ncbi:MAG TPA: electron transfer flavoprotein subunit beta/FixA family protein [Herbaspirillum sp.]|jgi:electron transfer flavoprotein beta subunit